MIPEAEKSPVVRDHRELLLSIQGVLAWILHTRAEEGGTGTINKAELRSEVKTYLETREHDPSLTEALFSLHYSRRSRFDRQRA